MSGTEHCKVCYGCHPTSWCDREGKLARPSEYEENQKHWDELVQAVTGAVLAERQRCAEICRQMGAPECAEAILKGPDAHASSAQRG